MVCIWCDECFAKQLCVHFIECCLTEIHAVDTVLGQWEVGVHVVDGIESQGCVLAVWRGGLTPTQTEIV